MEFFSTQIFQIYLDLYRNHFDRILGRKSMEVYWRNRKQTLLKLLKKILTSCLNLIFTPDSMNHSKQKYTTGKQRRKKFRYHTHLGSKDLSFPFSVFVLDMETGFTYSSSLLLLRDFGSNSFFILLFLFPMAVLTMSSSSSPSCLSIGLQPLCSYLLVFLCIISSLFGQAPSFS